ncbi:UdgX family uracil-DNA binding protein [Acidobacterium sp. S8]|uniref:UdgX family uracil-DNA binding protein n=1 Tax=Acidobacterium sp. S8 TaxID=1641854 RepID=UPI00131CDDBF|nr:UdgX family uracil-DNA binding protein [Acidobacterium sp. S8]
MPTKTPGSSARNFLPEQRDLESLKIASQHCKGCDLYLRGTQTVFGEGRKSSAILFVGEQPGDQEDLAGKPFVGPAGRLLDACMEEAGIDRNAAYVTNVVKHFKWEPRGKRRIHKKPSVREVTACRPWLDAEIKAVRPKMIVCLGATAAQSLLGSSFRVTLHRGEAMEVAGYPPIVATVHPSSILRARTDEDRDRERALFVADLANVAKTLAKLVRRRD